LALLAGAVAALPPLHARAGQPAAPASCPLPCLLSLLLGGRLVGCLRHCPHRTHRRDGGGPAPPPAAPLGPEAGLMGPGCPWPPSFCPYLACVVRARYVLPTALHPSSARVCRGALVVIPTGCAGVLMVLVRAPAAPRVLCVSLVSRPPACCWPCPLLSGACVHLGGCGGFHPCVGGVAV
jgi:hypothetical protein